MVHLDYTNSPEWAGIFAGGAAAAENGAISTAYRHTPIGRRAARL